MLRTPNINEHTAAAATRATSRAIAVADLTPPVDNACELSGFASGLEGFIQLLEVAVNAPRN